MTQVFRSTSLIRSAAHSANRCPRRSPARRTRWRARYVDNGGREIQRSFDKKVDAQNWLDAQFASLLRGDYVAPADAKLTVGQWCDTWLVGYGARRESSVRMAEVHLKIIKAHFGAVPLSAVKPSDVRAWTTQLKQEGRAPSYVYALHSRLSQLFSDAVHDGLVARNPCSRRTSPPMGKQRHYVATTEQVWALHDAFPAGVRPAILLAAHAGLRQSRSRVSSRRSSPRRHAPGTTRRSSMTSGATPRALGRSSAPCAMPATGSTYLRASGSTIMRHYFASLLIASGLDVKVVQARLRHASAKTTLDTYGHLLAGQG